MTLTRNEPLRPRCATCSKAYSAHTSRMRHIYIPKTLRSKRDPSGLRRITRTGGKPARLKSRLSDNADAKAREICYRSGGVQFAGDRRLPATGTCACCSERETALDPIEWAHSFPRANRRCRWEAWGAFPIKKSHHRTFTRDPEAWRAFLVAQWGEDTYLERYRISKQTFGGSITVLFYRELIERLRADLAQMKQAKAA